MVEFDHFKKSAGLPTFVLSTSEWIETTKPLELLLRRAVMVGSTLVYTDWEMKGLGSRGNFFFHALAL